MQTSKSSSIKTTVLIFVLVVSQILSFTVTQPARAASILYVDASAVGDNDGTSWADAFIDLQSALSSAQSEDEIRVAAGTYSPGPNRGDTFQLLSEVTLLGGFPSSGGDLSERDWQTNLTILSGEIGVPGETIDNTYNIVTGSGVDSTAILDGFIIQDAYTNSKGGGMLVEVGSPTILNSMITNNIAQLGGGMAVDNGSPHLENVTFEANQAYSTGSIPGGGGIYIDNNSDLRMLNVDFINNNAHSSVMVSQGGGVYIRDSQLRMIGGSFRDNRANASTVRSGGGGGLMSATSTVNLVNIVFENNIVGCQAFAGQGSGGGISTVQGTLNIDNVIFFGNAATFCQGANGGAIRSTSSETRVRNTIIAGNSDRYGAGAIMESGGSVSVVNSIIWDNGATDGLAFVTDITYSIVEYGFSGIGNLSNDPLFVDLASGDLNLRYDSPAIDAGNNSSVSLDEYDLDNDGNTSEQIPIDIKGQQRFFDMPVSPNSGNGTSPLVDMGAYEIFNTAPTLDTSVPLQLSGINEDDYSNPGDSVASLIASGANGEPVEDSDPEALGGVAIIAINNNDGVWQFSINGGTSWSDFGTISSNAAVVLGNDHLDRIRFVPDLDYFGVITDGLTLHAWDRSEGHLSGTRNVNIFTSGGAAPYSSEIITASLEVRPANETPTLDPVDNISILEDGNSQSITLTGISAGREEPSQVLTLTARTDSSGRMFSPEITYIWPDVTATLTITPSINAFGTVPITVTVSDDGGTANGGIDSISRIFEVSIFPVNDIPTFSKGEDPIVLEDSGLNLIEGWATEISPGPENESDQSLIFVLTPDNPGLFSSQPMVNIFTGDLTFTPAFNIYGNTSITTTLRDNGGTSFGGTDIYTDVFAITILPVNDLPIVTDFYKVGESGTDIVFTQYDFENHFSDLEGENLEVIKIVSLPEYGILKLNERIIEVEDEIPISEASLLTFSPGNGWFGATSFIWNGSDGSDYAVNGAEVSIIVVRTTKYIYLPLITNKSTSPNQ